MPDRRRSKAAPFKPQVRSEEDPMYGVAMLRIAMELKKSSTKDLDEILPGVLRGMRIEEKGFRAYLAQNGGLLRRFAAQKRP